MSVWGGREGGMKRGRDRPKPNGGSRKPSLGTKTAYHFIKPQCFPENSQKAKDTRSESVGSLALWDTREPCGFVKRVMLVASFGVRTRISSHSKTNQIYKQHAAVAAGVR